MCTEGQQSDKLCETCKTLFLVIAVILYLSLFNSCEEAEPTPAYGYEINKW